MYDNIYGGIQSPGWYQFDKIIYSSANGINPDTKRPYLDPTDEIMLGRYVLLCYCRTAFTEEEKLDIENRESDEGLTNDKLEYWKNYNIDNKISKDRMIYKKIYTSDKIEYVEIGRVNDVTMNDARIKIITWEEY